MFTIKQLKDLKQEKNKWVVQVEWEGHPGCDTWEPIKNILKDAKPNVISLLEKYKKKENLPNYLRKLIGNDSGNKRKNPSKEKKVAEKKQKETVIEKFKCQNIHKQGAINNLETEWDARYGSNAKFYLFHKKCYGCNKIPFVKGEEMNNKKYFRITRKKPCHVCEFMKNGTCSFYYCHECYTEFARTTNSRGIDEKELLKLNVKKRNLRNTN